MKRIFFIFHQNNVSCTVFLDISKYFQFRDRSLAFISEEDFGIQQRFSLLKQFIQYLFHIPYQSNVLAGWISSYESFCLFLSGYNLYLLDPRKEYICALEERFYILLLLLLKYTIVFSVNNFYVITIINLLNHHVDYCT